MPVSLRERGREGKEYLFHSLNFLSKEDGMDYDGFLELAEEDLAEDAIQKEGIEALEPEQFVTAVTIIDSPTVQQTPFGDEVTLVIRITKEV